MSGNVIIGSISSGRDTRVVQSEYAEKRDNKSKENQIFISFSGEDAHDALQLKKIIQSAFENPIEVFVAHYEGSSMPGEEWFSTIKTEMDRSPILIALLSETTALSKWVHFEAGYVLAREGNVIPLCLPPYQVGDLDAPLNFLNAVVATKDGLLVLLKHVAETFGTQIRADLSDQVFEQFSNNSEVWEDG